jgi:hypothetical protein
VHRLGGLLRKPEEEELAIARRRGAREARAQSAIGIGRQGELRHGEELAADVLQGQVHLALPVGKDAVSEHTLGEAHGFGSTVAALDADQREDALADGRDVGAVDRDLGV